LNRCGTVAPRPENVESEHANESVMKIVDPTPDFESLLRMFGESSTQWEKEKLSIQLAVKCAICSKLEWTSLQVLFGKVQLDYELTGYLILVASIGRLKDRSPLQHAFAVSLLRERFPSDSFLDRPFCKTSPSTLN
jgi:hypothetical protein